jgi:hypothetical protein
MRCCLVTVLVDARSAPIIELWVLCDRSLGGGVPKCNNAEPLESTSTHEHLATRYSPLQQ